MCCPKEFPQDSGGFEVCLERSGNTVQRWEVLGNDIVKASDHPRHRSRRHPSSADTGRPFELPHDGHWIMVLEREAPQADLSKERGFDVCAVTLRTACAQALTSYARCDIHLQVPPNANQAKVTFEVVDVRHPILSVAGLVTNGHRETFRGQEVELSTAGRAVAPLTRIRGLWYLLVWVGR